ncbi:hypothetical protein Terro_0580 [Terriglobus roseus DSM 18391]|uniref:Methyltransferase domain-containing protein n=1 Tax=Terriglobus roseus (strain DSM 18391 / NRRL B-41598 / KBS 63) TaxID=926566 RepID=I3ZCF2_TERRK|nr:class I SAM-dependent methyltransferase [Terriglobus roseus]AFL86920.1 hypothetical protein Terro_0580 [Terriglobus roseus DSM 18391]
MTDPSNGYEAISTQWLATRGNRSTHTDAVGVPEVRRWAKTLPQGSSVIDLGCGPGFPITAVLLEEGLEVFGVDASPSLVAAFQQNLPGTPVRCESVLDSTFFDRTFEAVVAIGLIFLLKPEEQPHLLHRITIALAPGGRLLFTAPAQPHTWTDLMTGLESTSLGAEVYRTHLAAAGLTVTTEFEDQGQNHYIEARKTG